MANISRKVKDLSLFVRRWAASPGGVGTVVPSGAVVGKNLAAEAKRGPKGYVVELGPGTGAITRHLLASIGKEKLIVIERDPEFYRMLSKRFPGLKIILGDASNMSQLLKENGVEQVASIVSCVPMLTLPEQVVRGICASAKEILHPQGTLIQITYGHVSPIHKEIMNEFGLKTSRPRWIFLNIPPTAIWRYQAQ